MDADDELTLRYRQLPSAELPYLQALLEGYEGLATVTTVDGKAALVEIATPASRAAELDLILSVLAEEIPLAPAVPPAGWQPLGPEPRLTPTAND